MTPAEAATKLDLEVVRREIEGVRREVSDVRQELAELKAELTWRMVIMTGVIIGALSALKFFS